MCGIAGLIGPEATQANVECMLQAIVHRGPDDSGTDVESGVALGARRLSILDLGGGHQPMVSDDGRYTIVFNGEIYNYVELAETLRQRGVQFRTHCDTEVILRLVEAEGEESVRKLRGMFAFAIWDRHTERLLLVRDRLGKKPLYYGWVGNTFAFGSELKCFRRLPAAELRLDTAAVAEYFTYRYVSAPRTIFAGFRKLRPGHTLRLEAGDCALRAYWEPRFGPVRRLSPEEAEETFARLIEEAVVLRLRSDVPVGAFLSGGLDSSVAVALMARNSTRPVQTFTVQWRGHDAIDEAAHARAVAELCETDHQEVTVEPNLPDLLRQVVWHLDEPLADPAALPTFVMSQVAGRSVKVVLTGEGGDELFGGYPFLRTLNWLRYLPRRPAPAQSLARLVATTVPRRGLGRPVARAAELLSGDLSQALRTTLSAFREHERARLLTIDGLPSLEQPDSSNDLNGLLRELATTWLPDELLMKVDKMTMAASLEARAPYLDHCLFEFVAGLPGELKVNRTSSKVLLRRAARRWLPPGIVDRPKHGFFVPLDSWLRGPLRPLLAEALGPSQLASHGLLEPKEVARLVDSHQAGQGNALQLWTVLSFQLWYESFGCPAVA